MIPDLLRRLGVAPPPPPPPPPPLSLLELLDSPLLPKLLYGLIGVMLCALLGVQHRHNSQLIKHELVYLYTFITSALFTLGGVVHGAILLVLLIVLLPASLLYTAIVRLRRGSTRTPPPEEPKPPRRSRMHSGWADLADDPVPPILRAASAAVLRAVGVGAAVPPPAVTPESPRKFTLGSVRVAPLVGVPMQRRRQTFAVFSFLIQPLSAPVTFLGVIILAHRAGYGLYVGALAASYIGWIWFGDSAPSKMPRTLPWLRRSIYFKWARDFFPAQLVKTAALDAGGRCAFSRLERTPPPPRSHHHHPHRRYVFGYHPHGIMSVGAFLTLGTDACNFDSAYPGIDMSLLTLPVQFRIPLWRDVLLALGMGDSSISSIQTKLKRPGSAVALVIGGAKESLDARPGRAELTLLRRRGFVREAIKAGASLVPCFCFGENDLFEQLPNPEGSAVRKVQDWFKANFSFAPPLFHGRGVFTYNYGLMPRRRPVTLVVGAPIKCPHDANPSNEMLARVHKQYVDELQALHDTHKHSFGGAAERLEPMLIK